MRYYVENSEVSAEKLQKIVNSLKHVDGRLYQQELVILAVVQDAMYITIRDRIDQKT